MIHLTGLSIFATLSFEKKGLFPTISFGEVNLFLGDIILYLGELGPPPRKPGMTGGTCPSPTFSLKEVKLFAIFSLRGKNLPFGGVILSSSRNLHLLRGATPSLNPPLGNLPLALSLGKIVLFAFFLGTVTFPISLSFRGVNLPLEEKALFLEEHSLNLPASFSPGAMNLSRGKGGPFYSLFYGRNKPISKGVHLAF